MVEWKSLNHLSDFLLLITFFRTSTACKSHQETCSFCWILRFFSYEFSDLCPHFRSPSHHGTELLLSTASHRLSSSVELTVYSLCSGFTGRETSPSSIPDDVGWCKKSKRLEPRSVFKPWVKAHYRSQDGKRKWSSDEYIDAMLIIIIITLHYFAVRFFLSFGEKVCSQLTRDRGENL